MVDAETGRDARGQCAEARERAEREAALSGSALPGAPEVSESTLSDDPATRPLPAEVTAAVNGTSDPAMQAGAASAAASPELVNEAGISTEQDFEAVSTQRSIRTDAQLIAENRAQYTVVEPTDLPTRPGSDQPNIVEYALQTTNPVGVPLYPRSGLRSSTRSAEVCAGYRSSDQAQMDFLSRGGPQRDRKGLDPDGDGFACSWDPRPFRSARRSAAPAGEEESAGAAPVADPLAISTE